MLTIVIEFPSFLGLTVPNYLVVTYHVTYLALTNYTYPTYLL